MITLFRSNTILTAPDAKKYMAEQIRQLPQRISSVGTVTKIFRYELPCESINLLSWLKAQAHTNKMYWSDRDGEFEVAGVGIAHSMSGQGNIHYSELFNSFEDYLSADNPRLRFYGGFAFNPEEKSPEWKTFGSYRFMIPRFEIFRVGQEYYFACNFGLADVEETQAEKIFSELNQLDFSFSKPSAKASTYKKRTDVPNRKEWEKIFKDVFQGLQKDEYEKFVLARKSVFTFPEKLDSISLTEKLKNRSPGCFHFCFQSDSGVAFVGASPERLYKREGRQLETEAIAGTRPRGRDAQDDERLRRELINSQKEIEEHKYVSKAIEKILNQVCETVQPKGKLDVLKLEGSYHLITRFKGTLKNKIFDEQIFSKLHPTPAVGTYPAELAQKIIPRFESFSRGWYAGAVGFIGFDQTEFAVAIRSGLVDGAQLSLYGGAGIIDGSKSDLEWEEIENKIGSFMKAFE